MVCQKQAGTPAGKGEKIVEKRENFSRKRMAILGVLQETTVHPTAEWVYRQLEPHYPNLSLGTVYRNLRKFCDSGRAVSVGTINGQERFDGCVTPHAHLVCDKCGCVLDVQKDFFEKSQLLQVAQDTGCEVKSASVLFHGVCPSCRRKESGKSERSH